MIDKDAKIYVAGHRGLVGSAIVRRLNKLGYFNLVLKTHQELDLTNQVEVQNFFKEHKPEYVFLAAAKVGGIYINSIYPAEFIYDNLMIQSNVIEAAKQYSIKRLLFLGSSCIYPRDCPQPMKEDDLLTGVLEKTNESYAIAKIAGIKLCEAYNKQYGCNFSAVMPTNLYGPYDNFDLKSSHVLPALIRKAHEAKINNDKQMVVWGSGKPLREFLYVDDMADACVFAMNQDKLPSLVNIGSGYEVSIYDLIILICHEVGFSGDIIFDSSKPDGTSRKLLDSSLLKSMGWEDKVDLKLGIKHTYKFYLDSLKDQKEDVNVKAKANNYNTII